VAKFILCGWDRGGVLYNSDYSLDEAWVGAVSDQGFLRFVLHRRHNVAHLYADLGAGFVSTEVVVVQRAAMT